ncbi:vWA domain-containing protein [Archangium sp.]|uniref:vWA domain-containing protein n=1 Tax=Archangium sp. TaxID=1872627 RepID=UPI002D4F4F06|nr:von Willebrand factor type A domain-containing protein [Archangium sp.]HYO56098.1 von Willebrand factor type A domain-containing protein [Archangium sp.]
MRRNPLAVTGVVCALAVGSWTLGGCTQQQESSAKLVVPELAVKQKQAEARMDAAPVVKKKESPPSAVPHEKQSQAPAAQLFGAGSGGTAQGLGGLGLKGGSPGGGGGGMGVGIGSIGTRGRGGGSALGPLNGKAGVRVPTANAPAEPLAGNTEEYRDHGVNPFVTTAEDRLSTFSIDVDTASYTLARRKILEGTLPPREAVRVEEFLNYFRYSYPEPEGAPLAVHLDAAPSPFTPGRHLLRVGVQGKRLSVSERKPAHLTFLVDVSGSMQSPDKLPLAKRSLRMLVDNLRDGDTVALVTYAGGVKLALPPTGLEKKALIHAAIEDLTAGGSTAMASGIQLAYQQAMKKLDGDSLSRVIILSDGDANVGPASHDEILELIRGYVKEGITVTTVGFGMGNYKDTLMERFADQGNGNHYYVDSLLAARRIFQEQLGGTLEVIAQDVKLQVEFDPAQVARYRLVGYENRDIADRDFRDDRVDAGEIGSGHTVTALYELELKPRAGEGLATVRVRAKRPRGETASERAYRFPAGALASSFTEASVDLRFATAVMGATEILRRSPHAERWSFDQVLKIARDATPPGNAEREEFVSLLERARSSVGRMAMRVP